MSRAEPRTSSPAAHVVSALSGIPAARRVARNTLYGATPSSSRQTAIDHHSSRIRGALQCDDVAHSTSARTTSGCRRAVSREIGPPIE